MAEGVTIPLDVDDSRARTKVARLKKEAGQAGRAYGQAASQAARVGGAAGGVMGRAIGGFSQGGAAGAIGLGLTAAGVGFNAFLARDAERVSLAKAREVRSQEADGRARTVLERRDQLAAGGLSFLGAARRIIARGNDNEVRGALATSRRYGLSVGQTVDIVDVSNRMGVSSLEIQKGMATGMLGDSAEQVAGAIQKYGGLHNAIAATQNVSADEAAGMIDRTLTDSRSRNLGRAGSAMNSVEEQQLSDLFGGKTADALERAAADQLHPGARLAAEAAQKMMEGVNQQRAAAESQSGAAALIAEMGRVLGLSEGSEARKLAVAASAASE